MEEKGLPFTAFDTDVVDHHNGVWDKVFVNLSDFGLIFAQGWAGVPNVYGPILLQVKPEVLREALDVAITLRSAGGTDFDREHESLAALDEVDRLSKYPAGIVFLDSVGGLVGYLAGIGFPDSVEVLFGRDDLHAAFPERPIRQIGQNPEVNCTVTKGFLSWHYVIQAIVDPYDLGKPLHRVVDETAKILGYRLTVAERRSARKEWYGELHDHVMIGGRSLATIANDIHASTSLRNWANRASAKQMEFQFGRYSRYITSGTFQEMG